MPTTGGEVCGACLKRPPGFDRTVSAFRYGFPLDAMIQQLKYAEKSVLAGYLADRLVDVLSTEDRPDLILPMPLHPGRLRQRGYNQAAMLAEGLSKRLGVRCAASLCQRIRDTPPQVDLPLKERRRNIKGAFRCKADLCGFRVALVDDVMTSGASLDELARTVKQAGAVDVSAWVIARTPSNR